MRLRPLLGWILPAIITVGIAGYIGAVATGRWRDPTTTDKAVAYPESTDPEQRKAQKELCPLIKQRDIVKLVEPSAEVKGVGTSYDPKSDWHQCSVHLPSGALRLGVGHDHTRMADYQKLFPEGQPRTVLGRAALFTAGPSILVNLPVKESSLLVAWDRADSGGMVEITVLRDAIDPRDEAALTQIAEHVLPSLPGWPG